MRNKKHKTQYRTYPLIILLVLLSIVLIPSSVSSEDQPYLVLAIYDCGSNDFLNLSNEAPILIEDNNYEIHVFWWDETDTPHIAYNVTIETPWSTLYISYGDEVSWISLQAPKFDEYTQFIISASKEGYISAEQLVFMSKGELYVTKDRDTVEEESIFSITVKDKQNNPVEGANLYFSGFETDIETTDEQGKAYINAPPVNDDEIVTINVVKSGYITSSTTIHVDNSKASPLDTILSPLYENLVYLFAICFLLFAILVVKLRNRIPHPTLAPKSVSNDNFQPQRTKPIEKSPVLPEKRPKKTAEPHVEIIRIHDKGQKQEKINDITPKKEQKELLPLNKNNTYEWFQGTDGMKSKINELTGEVNEKSDNKWFVGEDIIKTKVNKKVNDKKVKNKGKSNT